MNDTANGRATSAGAPTVAGRLTGRVALVTGATGTLGGLVAARLAADGAAVVLSGRDRARLESAAADLGIAADRWFAAPGDLDPDGATALARIAADRFGGLDIAVHLVGGYAGGTPIATTDPAELTSMLEQHVWTTFSLARAVSPLLAASGRGRFVAVTSPFAFNPPGDNAAYAAAKAAQQSLVRSLAQELRGTGATANALLVRTIDTARERLRAPSSANARWTLPEEIAATIAWLAGDDAAQVSGALIPLYGTPPPG